jgi:carbon-monoxide dehydrogenase medium subunit
LQAHIAATSRDSVMREFSYHAPASIKDAVALLDDPASRVLAGGTDLIPQLREGRRTVSRLVDLKRIPEVTELARDDAGGWRIGAAVTVGALGRNAAFVAEHAPLLAVARLIGSLQIQNRASLGGNLCNAAPSADAVPLLICLEAEAEIEGPAGRRRLPVAELASAPGRTSLKRGELLVTINVPPPRPGSHAAYLRFTPRREMDIAIVGAAAAVTLDDTGRVTAARIALASVAPTPLIAAGAAAKLIGEELTRDSIAAASAAAAAEARPISDTRGSAEYRHHLVDVLTGRALEICAEELGQRLQ